MAFLYKYMNTSRGEWFKDVLKNFGNHDAFWFWNTFMKSWKFWQLEKLFLFLLRSVMRVRTFTRISRCQVSRSDIRIDSVWSYTQDENQYPGNSLHNHHLNCLDSQEGNGSKSKIWNECWHLHIWYQKFIELIC